MTVWDVGCMRLLDDLKFLESLAVCVFPRREPIRVASVYYSGRRTWASKLDVSGEQKSIAVHNKDAIIF